MRNIKIGIILIILGFVAAGLGTLFDPGDMRTYYFIPYPTNFVANLKKWQVLALFGMGIFMLFRGALERQAKP
jgi:hypothetical protein